MAFFFWGGGGDLPKLKRGLGQASAAHFLHDFFHKSVFYLMLYRINKFQYHAFFPSQDIKQNVLFITFLFRQLMTS